jgi:hypothetical protein
VQLENGKWCIIAITEGFSQGCPVSPVSAELVLHDILSKIQPELERRATQRKAADDLGNDGHGSVDEDVNAVLHHQDVDYFLNRFRTLGGPLRAILNTKKLVS